MKHLLLMCTLSLLCSGVYAQSLGERLKNKVNEKVNQKVDEALSGDKKKKKAETGDGQNDESGEQQEKQPAEQSEESEKPQGKQEPGKTAVTPAEEFKSYSRFDFVPGEKVVYFDDFAQDEVGEFPLKWSTNSKGEIVTTNRYEGKWLKVSNGSAYTTENLLPTLPENFTFEYDVIMKEANGGAGEIIMQFSNLEEQTPALVSEGYPNGYADFRCYFYSDRIHVQLNDTRTRVSGDQNLRRNLEGTTKLHFSISVNKQRVRIWIDNEKIYDLPQLLPKDTWVNSFLMNTYVYNEDENAALMISNFRIAEGAPDMRSKLITEGKLVTRGITFDSGSDKIKPESFGTLKEIAKVLTENPAVKVKIVGHTDSDGSDAVNLELSKKRAAAIKDALVKNYAIEAARLQTDGKGEGEPAMQNTTPEGKANNRRVEFIKL